MQEILVWLKKYFLLKNELVKFIYLSSIHNRALENNLIYNINKCTVLQFTLSRTWSIKITTCFMVFQIILRDFTSNEHISNTDELSKRLQF